MDEVIERIERKVINETSELLEKDHLDMHELKTLFYIWKEMKERED